MIIYNSSKVQNISLKCRIGLYFWAKTIHFACYCDDVDFFVYDANNQNTKERHHALLKGLYEL